jgi:hypothetical protein
MSDQFKVRIVPPYVIADEGLNLTKDGEVVRENDPRGCTLFASAGRHIPMDEARKRGLIPSEDAGSAKEGKAANKEGKGGKKPVEPAETK